MRPSRVMLIVGSVVLMAVILICGLMYTSDQNTYDDITNGFRNNTQYFDRTRVDTIVDQLDQSPETDIGPQVNIDTSVVHTWLDACVLAHHAFYHAGITYQASTSVTINGMLTEADCNGYVGMAAYLYGLQVTPSPVNKRFFEESSDFTAMGQLDSSQYIEGDVLLYSDHVEVFVQGSSSTINVYQWGNRSTAEGLYNDGISAHEPAQCNQSILSASTKNVTEKPDVFRLGMNVAAAPPTPPAPQPAPQPTPQPPTLPGIPQQPANPTAGSKQLAIPFLIKQGASDYSGCTLGASGVSVSSSGCFACSLQMIANYLTSPNSAWSVTTIKNNFTLPYFNSSGGLNTASDYLGALTGGAYGVSTDQTPSVSDIENSINSNVPVILHFTGAVSGYYSGSGHFLVISGYDSDNFLLHDPGAGLQSIPKSVVTSNNKIKVRYIQ